MTLAPPTRSTWCTATSMPTTTNAALCRSRSTTVRVSVLPGGPDAVYDPRVAKQPFAPKLLHGAEYCGPADGRSQPARPRQRPSKPHFTAALTDRYGVRAPGRPADRRGVLVRRHYATRSCDRASTAMRAAATSAAAIAAETLDLVPEGSDAAIDPSRAVVAQSGRSSTWQP